MNLELARVLLRLDRPAEAVSILQPALRGEIDASNLYVTRTELHELLAESFARAGQADSAAAHYRAVVKAWRRADLEVWYHAERGEWSWRLLYRGGEDSGISEALRRLQQEGIEILPLEERPRVIEVSEIGEAVHRTVEAARPLSRVLRAEEHRAALEAAIAEAREELIIVSPWLTTAAVDTELPKRAFA